MFLPLVSRFVFSLPLVFYFSVYFILLQFVPLRSMFLPPVSRFHFLFLSCFIFLFTSSSCGLYLFVPFFSLHSVFILFSLSNSLFTALSLSLSQDTSVTHVITVPLHKLVDSCSRQHAKCLTCVSSTEETSKTSFPLASLYLCSQLDEWTSPKLSSVLFILQWRYRTRRRLAQR